VTGKRLLPLVRDTAALTARPFGGNFVLTSDRHHPLDQALDAGLRIVSFFLGDPGGYIEPVHDAGGIVMHTVGSAEEARRAVASGVDVIVAQGWEAGGHVGSTVATLPLVPAVVDAVTPVPVIAAGGIGDARGVAAVLALGAQAAWLGTRSLLARGDADPPGLPAAELAGPARHLHRRCVRRRSRPWASPRQALRTTRALGRPGGMCRNCRIRAAVAPEYGALARTDVCEATSRERLPTGRLARRASALQAAGVEEP
jgi:hypothetical protein